MKKIFKFVAPNGEFVKWGEFDENEKTLVFEVEKYSDNGVLIDCERIEFALPEALYLKADWKVRSTYRASSFRKETPPEQYEDSGDEDKRDLLVD